jgi:DNA mismatch endonuclease (patch repair protein)
MVSFPKVTETPVNPKQSARMSRVGRKHTKPELIVRKHLRDMGAKLLLHRKSLPGTPDICLPELGAIVFVHGCYWHRHAGCKNATTPSVRQDYWSQKFKRNQARDKQNAADLRRLGWRVHVVWECECRNSVALRRKLLRWLRAQRGELGTK